MLWPLEQHTACWVQPKGLIIGTNSPIRNEGNCNKIRLLECKHCKVDIFASINLANDTITELLSFATITSIFSIINLCKYFEHIDNRRALSRSNDCMIGTL